MQLNNYDAGRQVLIDRADSFWSKRIDDIRARRAAGQTMKQIAKAHNTSDTNILRVMRRFKLKENERAD
jgi:Mor family transcriptional regulator